ncbi:MAG TPA: SEC-C metal-binding domain-containing protein [Polyangia bacterium]|nr:SEC-C metal-binding domain-containing protein [Polyangia bacterium]
MEKPPRPPPPPEDTPPEPDDLLTHRGHDLHFLARLERVTRRETEIALRLYHEPDLVRALLRDPALPTPTERCAIPLAPGDAPPHVLVTHEGRFVTCLGAGMHLGPLPVLPWERVEHHLRRADRDEALVAQALSTLRDQDLDHLIHQLDHAGSRLPREDLQRLLAIAPLIHGQLVSQLLDELGAIVKHMPLVARIKRPHTEAPYLRAYWNALHRLGHLLVLTSHTGRRGFVHVERKIFGDADLFEKVYLPILAIGYGPLSLRALWAIARAGKLALPALKRALQDRESLPGWSGPALGLVAVALRHQRLRAEALGALSLARMPATVREDPRAEPLLACIHESMEHPKLSGALGPIERRVFAHMMACIVVDRATGRPQRTQEEMFQDEHALARLANLPFEHLFARGHLTTLLQGVMTLVPRPAEELYLPAAHIQDAPTFSPAAAAGLARIARPPDPVRAPERPGRNAPCPCGSGKKYKKCCGVNA